MQRVKSLEVRGMYTLFVMIALACLCNEGRNPPMITIDQNTRKQKE